MSGAILARSNTIRTCCQCGSHFRGEAWKRLCLTCWRWRMIGWHIMAAQRALKGMP
jgi:hypothetical protein